MNIIHSFFWNFWKFRGDAWFNAVEISPAVRLYHLRGFIWRNLSWPHNPGILGNTRICWVRVWNHPMGKTKKIGSLLNQHFYVFNQHLYCYLIMLLTGFEGSQLLPPIARVNSRSITMNYPNGIKEHPLRIINN